MKRFIGQLVNTILYCAAAQQIIAGSQPHYLAAKQLMRRYIPRELIDGEHCLLFLSLSIPLSGKRYMSGIERPINPIDDSIPRVNQPGR